MLNFLKDQNVLILRALHNQGLNKIERSSLRYFIWGWKRIFITLLQNADSRPDTKYRLQTADCRVGTESRLRIWRVFTSGI